LLTDHKLNTNNIVRFVDLKLICWRRYTLETCLDSKLPCFAIEKHVNM